MEGGVVTEHATFAEWAILELMGHRRLAGWLTEQEIAGAAFLRVDIPADLAYEAATQFYAPAAVYAITPTTEEIARQVATSNRPQPIHRWEFPALEAPVSTAGRGSMARYGLEPDDDELPDSPPAFDDQEGVG